MATGLLCALGAGLATAGSASASAADQTWNCRASAAYIAIPAQDRTEPVLANGSARTATESPDRARCADDDAKPVGPGNELGLTGPVAKTSVNPDSGLAVDQSVGAKSSVVDFAPGQAGNNLVVRGARAEATAVCTASGPALSGSSVVPVVTIGGRTLDVTQLEQTVERLSTGAIVRIKFNEQTRSGTTLVQRAVHLEVQRPRSPAAARSATAPHRRTPPTAVTPTGRAAAATPTSPASAAPSTSPTRTSASSRASETATSPTGESA